MFLVVCVTPITCKLVRTVLDGQFYSICGTVSYPDTTDKVGNWYKESQRFLKINKSNNARQGKVASST